MSTLAERIDNFSHANPRLNANNYLLRINRFEEYFEYVTGMSIPIELVRLPPSIKQDLLDLDCFLLPPSDMQLYVRICLAHGLTKMEGLRLLHEATTSLGTNESESIRIQHLAAPSSSGKTYMCHEKIASVLANCHRACVVYIDCDGSFSPHLILSIKAEIVAELDRLIVFRITTVEQLLAACHQATRIPEVGLVVIDSIPTFLRFTPSCTSGLRAVLKILQKTPSIIVNHQKEDCEPWMDHVFRDYC